MRICEACCGVIVVSIPHVARPIKGADGRMRYRHWHKEHAPKRKVAHAKQG